MIVQDINIREFFFNVYRPNWGMSLHSEPGSVFLLHPVQERPQVKQKASRSEVTADEKSKQ